MSETPTATERALSAAEGALRQAETLRVLRFVQASRAEALAQLADEAIDCIPIRDHAIRDAFRARLDALTGSG